MPIWSNLLLSTHGLDPSIIYVWTEAEIAAYLQLLELLHVHGLEVLDEGQVRLGRLVHLQAPPHTHRDQKLYVYILYTGSEMYVYIYIISYI